MTHLKLVAIVVFVAIAAIALVACENARPAGQPAQEPPHNQNAAASESVDAVNNPRAGVVCRATLSSYDEAHSWFDDSSAGHDDGVSPLATFVLVEPATYADRTVGILFKYGGDAATQSPPAEADIGCQFTFEIPEGFLTGEYKTIDNMSVEHFRKMEQ